MPESKIEKLTTQLMEHFCDNLCIHPKKVEDPEWLEDICADCKCGELAIGILNENIRLRGLLDEKKTND